MQIGPLNIPDRLLQAQGAGELVVFAGAGISHTVVLASPYGTADGDWKPDRATVGPV